jgi:hypothetical protein
MRGRTPENEILSYRNRRKKAGGISPTGCSQGMIKPD